MEEYFAAASPHLRALYYDRCSSREVNSKELKKLIGKATDLTRSCFETSNAIYNSEINKSPVSRAFTQLFTKMEMLSNSNSNAPIPSYFYNTQVDTCDWAEELVFPQTKQCSAAVKEYGWDQAEYRQTLLQVLKDNNIDTQKCLDCVIDDTSGDCVSVENTEKEVSCGNHGASSCAECPQGNGASWCNGECEWLDENGGGCQSKSKDEVRAIVKEEEEDIALPPSPNTRTHAHTQLH